MLKKERAFSIATKVLVFGISLCCALSLLSITMSTNLLESPVEDHLPCHEQLALPKSYLGKPSALVSFPYSGGIELRKIVERMSGLVTTMSPCTSEKQETEPCHDPLLSLTVSHDPRPKEKDAKAIRDDINLNHAKLVFLSRNPFDVIYDKYVKEAQKPGKTVPMDFVKTTVAEYKEIVHTWLGCSVPIMVVRLEDLIANPSRWGRIAFFLGTKVSTSRLVCATDFTAELLHSYPFSSVSHFKDKESKYILDNLHAEVCSLGYGAASPMKLNCEVKYLQLVEERDEQAEELDRLRDEFMEAQEKLRIANTANAPGMWYDGLRVIRHASTQSGEVKPEESSTGSAETVPNTKTEKRSPATAETASKTKKEKSSKGTSEAVTDTEKEESSEKKETSEKKESSADKAKPASDEKEEEKPAHVPTPETNPAKQGVIRTLTA